MLRSSVLRSYDSESLDDLLIGLQERGCSVTEVRSVEINTSPNNLSLKCNGFLILYDDPYVGMCLSSGEEEEENTKESDEPDDEDLTNEQKFIRDWGRRPFHANVVGSLSYEYICPATVGIPFDQEGYNPETGLCSANAGACSECAKEANNLCSMKFTKVNRENSECCGYVSLQDPRRSMHSCLYLCSMRLIMIVFRLMLNTVKNFANLPNLICLFM